MSMLQDSEARRRVDLTTEIITGERSIPLEVIASNVLIAWEVVLEDARLTASRATIKFMATYLPFDEFLRQLLRNLLLSLDFPEAFEVMQPHAHEEIPADLFNSTMSQGHNAIVFRFLYVWGVRRSRSLQRNASNAAHLSPEKLCSYTGRHC